MKKRFIKNSNFSGFMLVELAVSMLIIGIISAIVLVNYNAGRRQETLNRSAQRLAVAIRQAQNYALFSRVGVKCSTPAGGYGVYIESVSQYKIFGDCNGDHRYGSVTDDLISAVSVESGVVITGSVITDPQSFCGQAPSVAGVSLSFEPPIGRFYCNGFDLESTESKTIILQNSSRDASKQKTITISANGSVSVQ